MTTTNMTTTEKLMQRFPDLELVKLPSPMKHPALLEYNFSQTPYEKVVIPDGHVKTPGKKAMQTETVFERNIMLKMRDGIKIYTDVFRPATSDKEKVPAIIAWSPYGKNVSVANLGIAAHNAGVAFDRTSGYEKFEAPDPADWCNRGYAVVNPDARGSFYSEGKLFMWGTQEAE